MVDLNRFETSLDLEFSSDASANPLLGVGVVFNSHWLFVQWEKDYIRSFKPNIEYLELYGVVAAIMTWGHLIKNARIILYCDNSVVVSMINNMTSSCRNCMYLLRLLTLNNLVNNQRVFAHYISSQDNFLSDSLFRLQFQHFWRVGKSTHGSTSNKDFTSGMARIVYLAEILRTNMISEDIHILKLIRVFIIMLQLRNPMHQNPPQLTAVV